MAQLDRSQAGAARAVFRDEVESAMEVLRLGQADFALAVGHPAVPGGCVCRCGQLLLRFAPGKKPPDQKLTCKECGRTYQLNEGLVHEP